MLNLFPPTTFDVSGDCKCANYGGWRYNTGDRLFDSSRGSKQYPENCYLRCSCSHWCSIPANLADPAPSAAAGREGYTDYPYGDLAGGTGFGDGGGVSEAGEAFWARLAGIPFELVLL